MKKVLIVSGSLPPIRCGVGYYTAKLSREMTGKFDFELLSTEGVEESVPAPLATVPNWKIRSIGKMLKAIDRSGAGIVHIQYPAVGYRRQLGINLLPYILRLFRRKLKVVITLHEYSQSRWPGRWRNRFTIAPANFVIVSNQPDADRLSRFQKKLLVIPIGANFDRVPRNRSLYEKIMRAQKLDPAKPTLTFFGYAFPNKKLEVLLDALDEPELAGYQALLIGSFSQETDYHKMLKAKIDRINLDNIRAGITGFLEGPDASAVLQEEKYFVVPNAKPLSAKSGTAITAIENGLVVISKSAPNPSDSLPFVHLRNSYLLSQVSPNTIAAAVAELDADPAKRKTILTGAEKLKQYFSWGNIVAEHLKLYKDL